MVNHSKEEATFEYNYSSKRQKEIETIKKKYMPPQEDKMEMLRRLDRSADRPGTIGALVLGITGTLIFGTGMSLLMMWAESFLVLGMFVGIVGILMIASAYPVYKKLTRRQRERIAPQIFALAEELMNGKS